MYASRLQTELPTEKPRLSEATLPPSEHRIDRCTQILSDETHAMFLFGMHRGNALGDLPYESYRRFLEKYCDAALADIPNPNPLLRSMVMQAAMFDHVIAKLCSDGLHASDTDTRRSDLQLAASLTAEFRRVAASVLSQCAAAVKLQNRAKPNSRKKGVVARAK